MANPRSEEGKDAVRRECQGLLGRLKEAERQDSSQRLADAVAAWVRSRPDCRRLGVYAAIAGEPDLSTLHEKCPELELCYPLTGAEGAMEFHSVPTPTTLKRGNFGVCEPVVELHRQVAPRELDALLCPGLGFTRCGLRLGRGGGYYDRYLSRLDSDTPKLGVCFPQVVLEFIPAESHDMVMTHLVEEAGVTELSKV